MARPEIWLTWDVNGIAEFDVACSAVLPEPRIFASSRIRYTDRVIVKAFIEAEEDGYKMALVASFEKALLFKQINSKQEASQ